MTHLPRRLRLVIADDELRVRRGLAMRLGLEPDLDVVAQGATAADTVSAAASTRPDVVVLDVRMPPDGGLAAIPRLRTEVPDVRIVALSIHDDQATRADARRAGADAFVSKGDGDDVLLRAIRAGTSDRTVDGIIDGTLDRTVPDPIIPEPRGTSMLPSDALATTPTLTGERLQLRPLGPAHLEAFWASVNDPELRRLTGTTESFAREDLAAWLAARSDATDRLDLAIHLREDDTYVGELALLDLDAANASAAVRISLDRPDRRGAGYGREALGLLLDHAFDSVGLHRVGLDVFAFNTGAIRAYERLGFRHEGRRREVLHQDGRWHDALLMGLLRDEWQAGGARWTRSTPDRGRPPGRDAPDRQPRSLQGPVTRADAGN